MKERKFSEIKREGIPKPKPKRRRTARPKKPSRIKKAKPQLNEYESGIQKICTINNYPFAFKGEAVGRKIPDFINKKKRLIIEIHNPERSMDEVQERVRIFDMYGYKLLHLTMSDLTRTNWERFCTGSIKGFLG